MNREQMIDMLAKALAPQQTQPVIDLWRLADPFPVDAVSWRVGSTTKDKTKGMALAYIDARDVMDRLDGVVGAGNWRDEYTECGGFFLCKLWVRIDGEWVWKTDGAGKTDVEGEKGMVSDAFKRAAVKWGIGRYLYNLDSPWVKIEARGNSFAIADEAKAVLRNVLLRHAKSQTEGPQPPRSVAPVAEPAPTQPQQPKEAASPKQEMPPTTDAASVPAAPSRGRIADMIPEVPPTRDPIPGVGQFSEHNQMVEREKANRSKRETTKAIAALSLIREAIGISKPEVIRTQYDKWAKDTKKVQSQFVGPDVQRVAAAVNEYKAALAKEVSGHDPETGEVLEAD